MAIKFKDTMRKDDTLIVDALNLCFRWKRTGKYKSYCPDFISTVESIANSYRCGEIIICADQGSSSYRKEIYPGYKADRKERFKDQTEEEKQQFKEFFEEYENTLEECRKHYKTFRFPNVEADDIAAHLVKNRIKYDLNTIWLLSSDDDWSLLVNKDVSRFSWRTRTEITIENWEEHYEVPPEEFISYKVLVGDKSDNIPGITGIGPKRAAQLINSYGSAFDIYDARPLPGTAAYIKKLNDSEDLILTNYQLMDLLTYCDDAIGRDNIETIWAEYDIAW